MLDEGVGPVLDGGEVGRAILRAIEQACSDVSVVDRGGYLRVSVRERCVARRADIEAILGREFRIPGDLELVMPAFSGTVSIGVDEIVWSRR